MVHVSGESVLFLPAFPEQAFRRFRPFLLELAAQAEIPMTNSVQLRSGKVSTHAIAGDVLYAQINTQYAFCLDQGLVRQINDEQEKNTPFCKIKSAWPRIRFPCMSP
jgi:hypothetical protein